MNLITCPSFGVRVECDSTRGAYITFINAMINTIPFFCDRVYSYMDQVYIPTSKMNRHIVAHDPHRLVGTEDINRCVQLNNDWWLYAHGSPWAYANTEVARIEEAIQCPIVVVFESHHGVHDYSKGAHRNISEQDYLLLTSLKK